MQIDLNLLQHQAEFVQDSITPSLALIGGYGSGKTYSMAVKMLALSCANIGYEGVCLSPTYGMSTRNMVPALEELLYDQQIKFKFNKSALTFDIHLGNKPNKLHIMAAETYKRAAGLNAAFFGVDELDLMDPEVARSSWQMLTSRLRKGNTFQGCCTTTPEGFKFAYDFFVDEVRQNPALESRRRIIKARTEDNPYLPEDYIPNLRASYPPHLLDAYLNGEFVNLNGQVVYLNFDKTESHTNLTLADIDSTEVLHLGIDFNIGGCSCIAMVVRGRELLIVDELIGSRDTQTLCSDILKRYAGHRLLAHPDPACTQRRTSAVDTDLAIIRQNGIPVRLMSVHPAIKDRVNSVNAMFLNGLGDRRLKVNTKTCPLLVKALLSQTYDASGKPKKGQFFGASTGVEYTMIDGPLDGAGYATYSLFPLRPITTGKITMMGF